MFVQEVAIEICSDADPDDVFAAMDLLMSFYRTSGQKQGKLESQFLEGRRVVALPYTLEADSLAQKYENSYVKRQREELESLCGAPLRISCRGTTETEAATVCQCAVSPFYILRTDYATLDSPVRCGHCDANVPLYRLDKRENFDQLLSWETNYVSCDSLQMNCTVGERWATQRMSDPRSALSREGRVQAAELEAATGVPVFYYLYNYRATSAARDRKRPCPVCGQPWLLREPIGKLYAFMCEADRLISSVTFNSQ